MKKLVVLDCEKTKPIKANFKSSQPPPKKRSGKKRVLYVDDILVAEDSQQGLESSVGGLNIGCGINPAAGTFWSGVIDDVRIHSAPLRTGSTIGQ